MIDLDYELERLGIGNVATKKDNRYHRKYLGRSRYYTRYHNDKNFHCKMYKRDDGRIVRYYDSPRSEYYKKYSNKAIRYYKGEISDGRTCYKLYDYECQLY